MMIEDMHPRFQKHWRDYRFQLPTAIQELSYKPLKEGQDVVGLSPTGTGKTLAFALPLLENVKANRGLQLVILTPSQELGVQVGRVVEEWGALLGLTVQTLIGGANAKRQIEALKEKPEVVIGTTGRMLELADQKKLKLHQVEAVVLDEADHLMQPEHMGVLRNFIKKMPGRRQMAFYSATDSEELQNVSKWFASEPIILDANKEDGMADRTEHGWLLTENRKRAETLRRIGNVPGMQALVFVNSVQELAVLADKMVYDGSDVLVLHSDYGKSQRQFALESFRRGDAVFLLTTDLSARGIDIEDLPYVINYDLPLTREMYLHRSGRTGRMGKEGRVLSLVNERSLREVKKWVPRVAEFEQWYTHGGELVKELPTKEFEEETATDTMKPKVKPASRPKVAAKPKPQQKQEPATKVRKKNRKRDQKNKGARKKDS